MSEDSELVLIIKKRYKDSFNEKIEIITNFLEGLETQTDPKKISVGNLAVYQEIYDFLHKLAGSSGMYGFTDIAKQCREVIKGVKDEKYADVTEGLQKIKNSLNIHTN